MNTSIHLKNIGYMFLKDNICDDQGFVAAGELDPLNRRLCSEKKPDVVVQVVILAENNEMREKLKQYDIHVQTIADAAPIEVQPARVLSYLYTFLGTLFHTPC